MKICIKIIICITFFLPLKVCSSFLLEDIELFGTDVKKELITKHIPLCFGQTYDIASLAASFDALACAQKLKNILNVYAVKCMFVFYPNTQKAYLSIDVVEHQDKEKVSFRPTPTSVVAWENERLVALYNQFFKRLSDLLRSGNNIAEDLSKHYLDYEDAELHSVVKELIKLVPGYKANLLAIIKFDKDGNKRAIAAHLLNWVMVDLQDVIKEIIPCLDDENSNVRNNIARFIMYHTKHVELQEIRYTFIDYLLMQLNKPYHSDRNKALYNLLSLAENFDDCKAYIKLKGLGSIQSIAQTSILENILEPAQKLLTLCQ